MKSASAQILELGERPWGFYEVLSDQHNHKVKRITVLPGKRLSLQRHQHRQEHWFVVEGSALVVLSTPADGSAPVAETFQHGSEQLQLSHHPLSAGQAIDIPHRAVHRIGNTGSGNLVFIEVQTGTSFEESDIERIQDDFSR